MPKRLKFAQIERKPKQVVFVASYRDTIGFSRRPHLAKAFLEIRNAIEAGKPLPAWAYRKGMRLTGDKLLESDGFMHLHLGSRDSNELLWLVQYPEYVMVLEVSDHVHFRNRPPGTTLRRFHAAKLTAYDVALNKQKAEHRKQPAATDRKKRKD